MKSKYIFASFIASALIAVTLSAGANTIYEKYTAIARPDYKIIVDGQEVPLNTPPKTIEGATHLPVRELATILGKDVNFKSGIIELTTKEESEGEHMTSTSYTEFAVNGIEIVKNEKYDFATDTLLSINFTVFVESETIANFKEVDFFRYVSDGSAQYKEFIVPQSISVSPNSKTELEILVPVPNNAKITTVIFRDPISKEEISIDISDL